MQKELTALLSMWQRTRHPRVADLIDRVSARFESKPVVASSVPEWMKQVRKLAARATTDPTLVASLLATEWPDTWEEALPLLRAVLRLPDDPRVARALAEEVDARRYATWNSFNFYGPLFAKLNKLGDSRQTELLQERHPVHSAHRNRTNPTARDMRVMKQKALALHRSLPLPRALSAPDQKFLEALDAQFAAAIATERSRRVAGAALLDAVFANPADLTARKVYGDALVEHGDPRGELIALQFANDPTTEEERRTLIKKHWKKWLGPLGLLFDQPPEFELGFPSDGKVETWNREGAFRALIDAREWRTFRKLALAWTSRLSGPALVTHPNFQLLTDIDEVPFSDVRALLEKGSATMESLGIARSCDPERLEPRAFRTLPNLKRLTLSVDQFVEIVEALTSSIETIHFDRVEEDSDFAEFLERAAELTHVSVVECSSAQCRLRFTRGAKGFSPPAQEGFSHAALPAQKGFSRLELVRFDSDLLEILTSIPGTLESMTFAAPLLLTDFADQARATRVMKRFPHLTSPFEAAPDLDPHVTVKLGGVALGDPKKIPKVWDILTNGFGAKFDGFSVGSGIRLFEFGDDPVARLVGRTSKKANVELHLKSRSGPTEFNLLREKDLFTRGVLPLTDPRRFSDAFDALVAFARPSFLSVCVGQKSVRLKKEAIGKKHDAVHRLIMGAPTSTLSQGTKYSDTCVSEVQPIIQPLPASR